MIHLIAQFHCEVMKKPATKKSLEVKDPMVHLGDQHPTVLKEFFLVWAVRLQLYWTENGVDTM